MTKTLRNAGFLCASLLVAVPMFGQSRTVWRTAADVYEGVSGSIIGTVVDVNEANNRLTIQSDEDRYGQVRVDTDSVSTQYNGFGDVINGKPEIFMGSRGFSNVRAGDRLEIRGVGQAAGVVRADYVTLLGRTIPAPQTGVGVTRSPSTGISTPTVGSTTTVYGRIEGVIRQVDSANNRLIVETDRREIFTVRASNSTPVVYHGEQYQVSNLEVGDRVRIESDGGTSGDREIRARSIEVTQNVQEGSGARVSTVSGRVARVDRAGDIATITTTRGDVRVNMSRAYDANGRRTRAADLQVGDRVDLTGSYGANSNVFQATTVRFVDEDVFGPGTGAGTSRGGAETGPVTMGGGQGGFGQELVTVSLSGTVTETLQNAPTLSIRDRTSGRVIPVYVTEDFAVRTKAGAYTTADRLNVNDSVLVKAYRDADGNYIAQTIRIR